jgi:hypothetical protein
MHAYYNARYCDERCRRQEAGLALRIETAHRNGNGERSHGVTGRKRKAIRRRNDGPAVRLDLAGALPPAERLHPLKDEDGDESREGAGKESAVAILSAADEYKDTERILEPAVPQTAHQQHGDPYASRRAPAVQAAHQAEIALFEVTPHGPGYGHAQTSAGRLASDSIDSPRGLCEALTRALQRRANSVSSRSVAKVTTGTSRESGLNSKVQGRS